MKYIIDIPNELAEATARYWNETTDMTLVPYTEPDRKAIEDEVWNFVDFMIHEMDVEEREECFGESAYAVCIHELTYQGAKAEYDEWKKQKDEIRVGDEVGNGFVKGTAFFVDETMVEGFFIDDDDNEEIEHFWWNKRDCKKTGRHFDEVEELLKKMRGNEDE